jgi:hypothetical protein
LRSDEGVGDFDKNGAIGGGKKGGLSGAVEGEGRGGGESEVWGLKVGGGCLMGGGRGVEESVREVVVRGA